LWHASVICTSLLANLLGWLEFNFPFQYKYGYITNELNFFLTIILVDTILYKSLAVAEMGDHATAVGRKVGVAMPLSVGELNPHLTQCDLDRGISLCQVAT